VILANVSTVFRYHDGQLDVSRGWGAAIIFAVLVGLAIWKGHELF
jgi:hypothetical protein